MLYVSRGSGTGPERRSAGAVQAMCSPDLAGNRKGVAMNLQTLFTVCVAVLGGTAFAAEPQAASRARDEGLVAVHSWNLDELYLRPTAELAGYRKVLIDPVRAEVRSDWLKNLNYSRNVSRWVRPEDAKRMAAEATASLESILTETFKARGYEIATVPE